MTDSILVRVESHLATVTLNRPGRLNALDEEGWRLLAEAFAQLDATDEVRCVVLRGAGDRAFCAGADIREFDVVRTDSGRAREYGEIELGGIEAVAACRHPTIARIGGVCVGGGLEIAAGCDLRICSASSRFGVPVNRLGLTMAYGELAHLLRAVTPAVAAEILLAGEVFDADEALRMGLVSRVAADEELEAEVASLAGSIAESAPLVNRWHKKFIRRLQAAEPLDAEEIEEGFACFDTEDYRRGLEAFLAKRKPRFEGR